MLESLEERLEAEDLAFFEILQLLRIVDLHPSGTVSLIGWQIRQRLANPVEDIGEVAILLVFRRVEALKIKVSRLEHKEDCVNEGPPFFLVHFVI